jgi:hypothetical protein
MKILQQSARHRGGYLVPLLLLTLLFALLPMVLAGAAAYGAGLNSVSEQAILRGPPPGPCYGLENHADYAGGTNANGKQVAPAEGPYAAPPIQIPGQIILAHTAAGYIPVRIQGLNQGLAASNACSRLLIKEKMRAAGALRAQGKATRR